MKIKYFLFAAMIMAAGCVKVGGDSLPKVSPERMGMDSKKLSRVDSVVNKAVSDKLIPGAVLSVVRDDKIVYLKAYGYKSVVPDTVAMTTDVMFDLASLSKVVGTTMSVMQLVENGQIRLTDNVIMYIPEFVPWVDPDTEEKENIEIRDLLTHSSGLPAYLNVAKVVSLYGEPCPDSTMMYIARDLPRRFRPKTDFTYSCLNFVTLQNILQRVTGERLCDYAERNVFGRLGMKHTCYNVASEHPDLLPLVAPTEVQEDGRPLLGEVHDPLARRLNGGNSGNAGVFSTAEDLSILAAAIMNGGEILGRRVLGTETVKMMSRVPSENAAHIGRALGWDCWSDYSWFKGDITSRTRALNHTGYTGTSIVVDLDSKTAIILLTNRCHPEDKGALARVRATVANIVAGSIVK